MMRKAVIALVVEHTSRNLNANSMWTTIMKREKSEDFFALSATQESDTFKIQ